MASDRWRRVESIYHEALDRSAVERAAFVRDACAGDAKLRRDVESLLEYDGVAGDFLERPALEELAKRLAEDDGLLPAGSRVDEYEILSLLGSGGMGEIYRARDLALGREVAIKVVLSSAAGGPDGLRRFGDEARLASSFNHPNIVTIYGIGQKDDIAYIAMELVQGRTLRDLICAGPLALPEALRLAMQLADALAAAHAHGIVHRDLKPENLMVTHEGLLKVLDFGIARLHGTVDAPGPTGRLPRREAQTQTGTILGTIGYMSPEQADGRQAGPASDQFSFGVILYEMLSGRRAFRRETHAATLAAIRNEEPEPIDGLDRGALRALREVLERCFAKAPESRFPDTRELAAGLHRVAEGVERERADRISTRRRAIWLAGAAAVAIAAGLAGWKAWPRDTGVRSLAVLPFQNASKDTSDDYLCDGLTAGVIREISRLSSLRVKPRSAILNFKGRGVDPRAAGRILSADAVVTGTVTRKTDGLHVTAELVEVATGARLWRRAYDRASTDALSVQDDIARSVVGEGIRLSLSSDDRLALARSPTENPGAYDMYLRAIRLFERATEGDYLEARRLLQQAVAEDPNFALAYVALASTYSIMAVDGYVRPADALPEVSHNVRRALDCDPDLPDAHSEAAAALFYFQWDWAGAEQEWQRALKSRGGGIVPDFLLAYALQRWALSKPDDALALVRKARALDPLSLGLRVGEADFLLKGGSLDDAATQYESVIRSAPGASGANSDLVLSNAWLGLSEVRRAQGRFDEAIEATRRAHEAVGDDGLREVFATARGAEGLRQIERRTARAQLAALEKRTANGGYASPLDFARAHARLGELERAFRRLDEAVVERSPGLVFLNVDRAWDAPRADPRFLDVVRRVGLPPPS